LFIDCAVFVCLPHGTELSSSDKNEMLAKYGAQQLARVPAAMAMPP